MTQSGYYRRDANVYDADILPYWAFVSYSHKDRSWGRWIHRALEAYRVPRRLVGTRTTVGTVPKRLIPVFRDRDELGSTPDLPGHLRQALAGSKSLIVVCSPNAVASKWVGQEIAFFQSLGRSEQIFCLIVGGEPQASAKSETAHLEAFPDQIRFRTNAAGELTSEILEPLAADVRRGQDGRTDAKLKIIAGMLGVGFNELRQREKQRQKWRRIGLTAFATVVLAAFAVLWFGVLGPARARAVVEQRNAEARRLAAAANAAVKVDPQLGLLLSVSAVRLWDKTAERPAIVAEQALRTALAASGGRALIGHTPVSTGGSPAITVLGDAMVFSQSNQWLMTGGKDGSARIWPVLGDSRTQHVKVLQHGTPIRRVAFGCNDKCAVTVGIDGTALFWNLESSQPTSTKLEGHSDVVVAVQFSPDGKWLATAGADKKAILWRITNNWLDVATPVQLVHEAPILGIVFDPLGRWLATNSACERWNKSCRGALVIWDLADIRFPRELRALSASGIVGLAVTGDGRWLLSSDLHGTVDIWDTTKLWQDTRPAREIVVESASDKSDERLLLLAVSPDGRRFATAGLQSGVELRSLLDNGQKPTALRPPGAKELFSLVFSPDGRWIAVGGDQPMLWRIRENVAAAGEPIPGLSGYVLALAFSGDSCWMAAAGQDAAARLWKLEDGLRADGRSSSVISGERFDHLALGTSKRLVSWGTSVAVWDGVSGGPGIHMIAHPKQWGRPNAVALNDTGTRIAATYADGTVRIWDISTTTVTEAPLLVLSGSSEVTKDIALSPDDRWVASVAADGTATLWNLTLPDPVAQTSKVWRGDNGIFLDPRTLAIERVVFSPDGRLLAMASYTGAVGVLTMSTRGAERAASFQAHEGQLSVLAFSRDSQQLLTAGIDGKVRLWRVVGDFNTPPPYREFSGHEGWVHSAALSPDGRWLAAGGGHVQQSGRDTLLADSRVLLWNLHDPRHNTALTGHSGWVRRALFSPDGRWLATMGEDGVRLWPLWGLQNAQESLFLQTKAVSDIVFSADGNRVVAVNEDRLIEWDLDIPSLIAKAKDAAGRNFNENESQQYFPGQAVAPVFPDLPNPSRIMVPQAH